MRAVPDHEEPAIHAFLAAGPAEQVAALRREGLPEAVALILVNACANRCFFCAGPGTVSVDAGSITRFTRIREHLEARPAGVVRLLIGGNEPTLHPDFERSLELAHQAGFEAIELMTSGLALADRDRLARWVALGLREVAVPIYATSAAVHDAICGTRCFDRLALGLDSARAHGVRVHLHTLALRRNEHELAPLARLAAERWGATLAIAPLREKAELFRFADEAIDLARLAEILAAIDVPVALLGMPTCAGRDRPRASSLVMEMYFRTQRRRFAPSCDACLDRPTCPGVVAGQLDAWGERGIAPRHAP